MGLQRGLYQDSPTLPGVAIRATTTRGNRGGRERYLGFAKYHDAHGQNADSYSTQSMPKATSPKCKATQLVTITITVIITTTIIIIPTIIITSSSSSEF